MLNLIKANQHGFTLIEIMAAVAIMAIAFTAILSLHSQSLTMNMAGNFYTRAPLLTKKIIAEWEAEVAVKGSAVELRETLDGFPGYSYEISELEMESQMLFPETTEHNNARIIELTCTLLYNDGEYSYTTKTLKLIK